MAINSQGFKVPNSNGAKLEVPKKQAGPTLDYNAIKRQQSNARTAANVKAYEEQQKAALLAKQQAASKSRSASYVKEYEAQQKSKLNASNNLNNRAAVSYSSNNVSEATFGTVSSGISKASTQKSSASSKKSGINTKAAKSAHTKVKGYLTSLETNLAKLQKDVEAMNVNHWYGSKPANTWYKNINKTYQSLVNFDKGVSQLQNSLKSLFSKASSKGINF